MSAQVVRQVARSAPLEGWQVGSRLAGVATQQFTQHVPGVGIQQPCAPRLGDFYPPSPAAQGQKRIGGHVRVPAHVATRKAAVEQYQARQVPQVRDSLHGRDTDLQSQCIVRPRRVSQVRHHLTASCPIPTPAHFCSTLRVIPASEMHVPVIPSSNGPLRSRITDGVRSSDRPEGCPLRDRVWRARTG